MGPADLAGEYGCSNGHVRNVLSDLLSDEEVARVGRGEYVAPPPDDEDGETDVLAGVPADIRESGAAVEDSDGEQVQADSDSEGNGLREDGPAHSEDRDTTAGDRESDDEMVTEEEYTEFHEQSEEDDEGNEEIDADDGGEDTDESGGDVPSPATMVEETETVEKSGGIPIPVSTTTLFAGVVLALAVMYWYSKQSGGGSERSGEAAQGDDDDPSMSPTSLIE
jgi:hypothetical protein